MATKKQKKEVKKKNWNEINIEQWWKFWEGGRRLGE